MYNVVGYLININYGSINYIFCADCFTEEFEESFIAELHLKPGDNYEATPLYDSEEWDGAPVCEECGEPLDVIELMHKCNYCKEVKYDIDEDLTLCPKCLKELEEYAKEYVSEVVESNSEFIIESLNKNEPDDDILDNLYEVLDNLTQYADYANNALPKLRQFAGFEDSGIGTYREIPEDENEDEIDWNYDQITDYFFGTTSQKISDDFEQFKKDNPNLPWTHYDKQCNICHQYGARYYGKAPEEDYDYYYCDQCKKSIIFTGE